MPARKVLTRLEARLYFHVPCFTQAEIVQALRLVKAFPDLRVAMQHITNQDALFPNKAAILGVLKAEHEEENGQDSQKITEENPFTRARRLQKEAVACEAFRKKVGQGDWKKVKKVIDHFQGRIIAIT